MRILVGIGMAAIVALSALYAFSPRHTPPLAASQIPVGRMQFNAVVRAGNTLVAGGELGYIMWSDNDGRTWQPASVEPRRYALITDIVFQDDKNGMALAHEGQILRTADGGRSWKELRFDEERGEPLMGIARLPSGDWLAVGAFGRALRSSDDGKTWNPVELPGAGDKHMNRIVPSRDGKRWVIVGEHGLVLTSTDGGQTWNVVPPFYNGSLYGAVQLADGHWVAYGMRGNVFRADADLTHWAKAEVPAPISLFNHALAPDGALLLTGQGGTVLRSTDGGATFTRARGGGRAAITELAFAADGSWVLASDAGMTLTPDNVPMADGLSD